MASIPATTPQPTIDRATLIRRLINLLGPEQVMTERGDLLVYDSDGTHEHALPDVVVLPTSVSRRL
jgi:hypothetical protein